MGKNHHSHNDYWCRYKFNHALNEGCNIIELDIIYLKGKLYLSHSWRPVSWLTYGDPEEYFRRAVFYKNKNIYLYIEIKTSDERAIPLLLNLIDKYDKGIYILIKGINRWFSPRRKKIADEIYKQNDNVMLFDNFNINNDIECHDLYRDSRYKFWNRW